MDIELIAASTEAGRPTDQRFRNLIQELFSLVQELFHENDDLKKSMAQVKQLNDQVKNYEERVEKLEEVLRLLASTQLEGETVGQLKTKVRKLVAGALKLSSDSSQQDPESDVEKSQE